MALGEIVSELKAKATSVKVQPFDGQGVRLETNLTLELNGRITGTEVGTAYGVGAPDGTATSKTYGVITTNDGESITAESFAIVCPPTAKGSKFRGIVYLRTSSQKYAWVNTTPMAFEGEINRAQTELSATLYEWK
jgi:hypothetical protein